MKCRKKALETMEKATGVLAKKAYYFSNDKVQSSLGRAVSPSLLINQLDEDILDCFLRQEQLQKLIFENIGLLEDLLLRTDDLPFDKTLLEKIISQLKQQHLLESSITETLARFNDQKIEQADLSVMLASFRHAPYIRDTDIEAILNL
ncbi:hypothetical protein EON65_48750 [archaeon]|nr:MAG: hypothetical protein EON65_48750 [archaeon]